MYLTDKVMSVNDNLVIVHTIADGLHIAVPGVYVNDTTS